MLYYVFNDKETALNAEEYICQITGALSGRDGIASGNGTVQTLQVL